MAGAHAVRALADPVAQPDHQDFIEQELRAFALALPETHEDFPWGHRTIKVRSKIFVMMNCEPERISFSMKLPQSREFALDYRFTEPTGYGLGRSGWVTARFDEAGAVPLDVLQAWIAESYRAVAPKKLAAQVAPRMRAPVP